MPPALVRRRPTSGPPRPAILLRAVPAVEPPFDDEMPPRIGSPSDRLGPNPQISSTVTSGACPRGVAGRPGGLGQGTSPDSWHAARRFVGVCMEILNGHRPIGHIRPMSGLAHATTVIEQLALARERAAALTRRGTRSRRPVSRTARPRSTRGPEPRRDPVRLGALKVCEPRSGVAEAAAVVHAGGRAWALAFRLERRRGKWLCTAVRTI